MRIWLIEIGEPLPIAGSTDRLLRYGILADILVQRGHDVVWWSSTFDHWRKRHIYSDDTTVDLTDKYQLKLLHAKAYINNVSFRRILNHRAISQKFITQASIENKPDIILCGLPTLELCLSAVDYGRKNEIPIIIDVQDLWPDVFLDLAPKWLHPIAKFMLFPVYHTLNKICSRATSIIGLTSEYVDWALERSGRTKTGMDRSFPLGYSSQEPDGSLIKKAEEFWEKFDIGSANKEFIVCFFGTIGRQFDLSTVIDAATRLQRQKLPIRFVLCGVGDNLGKYRTIAANCKSVIFPGWVGQPEIWTLMRWSSVGLAPYVNSNNFKLNLPNKPIEYLSAGLPIVTCLDGVLNQLIKTHNCGLIYEPGDGNNLASLLSDFYHDPDRRMKISQNAYRLYQAKFTAEKVYHEMAQYLEDRAHYK